MRRSDFSTDEPLPKKRKLQRDLSYCNVLIHKNTPNREDLYNLIQENEGRAYYVFSTDFHITHLLCTEEIFDLKDPIVKLCFGKNVKIITPSYLYCEPGEEDMHTIIPVLKDVSFSILLPIHEKEEMTRIIKENCGNISQTGNEIIITSLDYLKRSKDLKQLEPLKPIIYSQRMMNCVVTPKGIVELVQKKFRIESMNIFHMIKRSEYIQNKQIINLKNWDEMESYKAIEKRRIVRKMNCKIYPFEFSKLVFDFPLKIWGNILTYLNFKDWMSVSLVSKDLYSICLTPVVWKILCRETLRRNIWIPQVSVKMVNLQRNHWYKFFRESIYPLLVDSKSTKTPQLGLFLDLKKSNNIKMGSSKFGGQADLPNYLEYPVNFQFLFQLNLEEIYYHQSFVTKQWNVPKKGIIYFFISNDSNETKYLFHNGDSELEPSTSIDNFSEEYQTYTIDFFEMVFPSPKDFKDSQNSLFATEELLVVDFVMNQELGGFDERFHFKINL